jgi:hypothetical protein
VFDIYRCVLGERDLPPAAFDSRRFLTPEPEHQAAHIEPISRELVETN